MPKMQIRDIKSRSLTTYIQKKLMKNEVLLTVLKLSIWLPQITLTEASLNFSFASLSCSLIAFFFGSLPFA